jgi:glycosyltransferase involved in cell wall biosynthesis
MKNLEYAIEVLRKVQTPVLFDVYGPVRDDSYWNRCRELIASLPAHVTAAYHGSVEPDAVASILSRYDVLFLPTMGENYGHVIIESLAAGTPVLIADTTPWRNLADGGVGWDLPLNQPEGFLKRIEDLALLTEVEWELTRRRAAGFAERVRSSSDIVMDNKRLFVEPVAA